MHAEPMVTIELLGTQRAVAGIDSINMPIREMTVMKDVLHFLRANFPEMDLDDKKLQLAVNYEIVSPERVLNANDTVCLIPHIGGG
jgi:molybdopterin converting factor small subunit